jgi:hypothetical protein
LKLKSSPKRFHGARIAGHAAGRAALLLKVVALSACGDGSQVNEFAGDVGNVIGSEQINSQLNGNGPLGSMPLSSDGLMSTLEKYAQKLPPMRDVHFSSALGDLPERIVGASEGLGLVSNSSLLSFDNVLGALPDGLTWSEQQKNNPLELNGGARDEVLHDLQLSFENVPIHGARIKKIHDHSSNTTTFMSAAVPAWLLNQAKRSQRTSQFSLSAADASRYAAQKLNFLPSRFHSPEKIYIAGENQTLKAAYLLTVSSEPSTEGRVPRVPLEVAVDADVGEVLWQRPLAMHAVVGEAHLYVENKKVGGISPSTVQLPDLQGNGTSLTNPLFDVFNCHLRPRILETGDGSVCNLQVHPVTQGNFKSFSYSTEVYDELISYAALTKAMTWFRDIDKPSLRTDWDTSKWPGTRENFGLTAGVFGSAETRLKVFVRTRTPVPTVNQCGDETTPDNAQYLWSGQTGRGSPEILIGYGGFGVENKTCYKLNELGKDMDVVMHEFGHHVVFRGLSNSKNQSVAMHEGLADYFTYAISGNNFLAENSYPGFKSLRQGNITPGTTFKNFKPKSGGGYYSVMDLLAAPHAIGEFWSGILWEIRTQMGKDGSGSKYKFDKIVWDSVDLLKSEAGLYEGMIAFNESAKRYAERVGDDSAALQKIVQDTFVKYGFARYTSNGEFAAVAELEGTTAVEAAAPVSRVTKTRRWGCGVVAFSAAGDVDSSAAQKNAGLLLFALLLLPASVRMGSFFAQRVRVRKTVRVQSQRRRN